MRSRGERVWTNGETRVQCAAEMMPSAAYASDSGGRGAIVAAKKPSKQETQKIRSARTLITSIYRKDANEATTRQRIERVFMNVMGYDPLLHLSREHAVHGAGDTEHVDFAIQLEDDPDAPPKMMVELKRVGLDLTSRHLKQGSR